jgi:hypothetical protein
MINDTELLNELRSCPKRFTKSHIKKIEHLKSEIVKIKDTGTSIGSMLKVLRGKGINCTHGTLKKFLES